MTKRCADCHEEKSVEAFQATTGYRDGLHSYCRACNGRRANEYMARLRAAALRALGGTCVRKRLDRKEHRQPVHPGRRL